MKNRILTALLGSFVLSSPALAWTEKEITINGKDINGFKTHANYHETTAAHDMTVIKITGLEGGCTRGIFFDSKANSEAFSIALAAMASKSTVRITYDIDQKSPWGDTRYCALSGIEYQN